VYVPNSQGLQAKVTALHHDTPESGHFGALKTAELISRNFYWPALPTYVRQYCKEMGFPYCYDYPIRVFSIFHW
jgi:hypothetical protein